VAVRLRGRRWRAERGKRRLEEAEDPEAADHTLAVDQETLDPADTAAPGEGVGGTSSATDVVERDEGIVSIAPVTDAVAESVAEMPVPGTRATQQTPEFVEPTSPAAASSQLSKVRAKASRRGVSKGLGGLDEVATESRECTARPLPRIIAVANQKGGVGKTTTAVNLGAALAELSYRVLIVDLDPQANATTGVGIDARSFELSMYDVLMRDAKMEDTVEPTNMKNLFIAPATIDLAGAEIELVPTFSRELKLRRALESIAGDFDYTLVDCPPSLGLITVNGLAAADEVLVPIQCEYYALEGLGQLLRNVELVKNNLNEGLKLTTIVLTMYDGRTKLAEQVAEEVRSHFGNKVCRNVIPRTVRISEAPSFGQPITAFDPGSRGAIAYRELAKEVSGGAS
jgi:chromosome partitioning protein